MLSTKTPDVLRFATPCAVRLSLVELGVAHGVRAIALEKPTSGVKGVIWHDCTLWVTRAEHVHWIIGHAVGTTSYDDDHPGSDQPDGSSTA